MGAFIAFIIFRATRPIRATVLTLLAVSALTGLTTLTPALAEAGQQEGARLSRDLAAHLASGSTEPVQVILQGGQIRVQELALRYNLQIKRLLSSGGVIEVNAGQLDALSRDPEVGQLTADAVVQPTLAVTTQSTGAEQAWAGLDGIGRVTGRGIGIAVIDSGIASHHDLEDRVVVSVDFTEGGGRGEDEYGHGTHVAGIIAGNNRGGYGRDADQWSLATLPLNERYTGIAPEAHLINLRVLNGEGWGRASSVIGAIDWAIENRERYAIRVINISLGGPVEGSYVDDPMAQAVERAVAAGLVVVCSAGNYGKTDEGTPIVGGIVSPGYAPNAVTVGALKTGGTPERSDDGVASYSSRGPTPYDWLIKPDLVAPGNRIASLEADGSYLSVTYPERRVASYGTRNYFELSGTSMSAAVVSGAVALLLEANPELTPGQVKVALQLTSESLPGVGLIEAGAGSLDIVLALYMAEEGPTAPLPTASIANEPATASGLAFAMQAQGSGTKDVDDLA